MDSVEGSDWNEALVVSRSHDDSAAMVVHRDDAVRSADELRAPFPGNPWVFDRVAAAIRDSNQRRFRYELIGWPSSDVPVLLRYRAETGGHFVLHTDLGRAHSTRKLSFSLQLSAPGHYDGGTVSFPQIGRVAGTSQGSLTVFPSFVPHVVDEVTAGVRVALVGWFHGPTFR